MLSRDCNEELYKKVWKWVYFPLGIILVAAMAIPLFTKTYTENTTVNTECIELISMVNVTDTEGKGSLGKFSGSFVFNALDTYRYYYESDTGYIDQGSTPVDASHITYTSEPPYLEIISTTLTTEEKWLFLSSEESETTAEYIYHIPEGSVVTNYELQ